MYVLIHDKDIWTTVSSEHDNKALGLTHSAANRNEYQEYLFEGAQVAGV